MRRSSSPASRIRIASAYRTTRRRNKSIKRTFVERLHDFKAHLWWLIRHFFRGQFTDEARDSFREQQGKLGKRSQVVGATQFAQIPLLNASQLVARWKLETPPALVSETQQLPIDGLGAGVYLIEATDGTYKAYTVAIVTSMAVVERTEGGRADLYVADRKSGAPIGDAGVVLWANGQLQSSGKTGSDGMASLTMTIRGGAQGAEPENVWILASHGADAALVTPWGYNFQDNGSQTERSYIYTDRPVYRPRRYRAHQGHRAPGAERHPRAARAADGYAHRARSRQQGGPPEAVGLSRRTERSRWTSTSASDAALGYY